MSSSLSAYLLDTAATRALVGSRDDQLLDMIRTRLGDDLARADRSHSWEIEQGAPTAYEALRAVVHGGPFSEGESHASQYGYAYMQLCELTGSFLPNDRFTPHRGDWLSVVDDGLESLGITAVSVASFGYGGLPAPLPYTWIPGCGEWTPERIAKALEQYEAAGRTPSSTLDPETAEAAEQCLTWLHHASANPRHGLIGFVF
ncbi:hypothetical protein [Streptomyces sp. NPDC049881]|uniref:DUF7691 family protein n=1 Tax=Streptomyces sp. NPDC049881 TaxID=3155778 RepID=UPI003414F967